jgi:molecular chaperone GrpE
MDKKDNKKKTNQDMDTHTTNGKKVETEAPESGEAKEIPIEQKAEKEAEIPVEKGKRSSSRSSKRQNAKIEALQKELEETQNKLKEAENYNLRLNADFVNMRKRKEKEMGELVKFANEDLIKQLLPVLDDFERSLEAMSKSDNLAAIKEGIEGVNRHMHNILTRIGLEAVESIGEEFNSEIHEAITTIPAPAEDQVGKVVDEIEKGYKLKEKIIRFSKVIVGE